MKALTIAFLAAGTAILLAALIWPNHSPRAIDRKQHALPVVAIVDTPETRHGEEPQDVLVMPTPSDFSVEPASATTLDKPEFQTLSSPNDPQLTPEEQQTIKETATSSTALRNIDFPRTYISSIHVDVTSPSHSVRLTWSGPRARTQETGPFHSSPGRGVGYNNCDDPAESCRADSNCTPKGTMHVQAFSETMTTSPECRFVTWFQTQRGVAFHYYPFVPNYPASHGCVRLQDMHAAQLIHNNSKIGATEVVVDGKWKFAR